MKTRLHVLTAAGALLLSQAPAVNAASVVYDYAGTVGYCDDSDIGGGVCGVLLFIGDMIGGTVEFDATGGFTNTTFTTDDIVTYVVGLEGSGLGADPSNSDLDPASFLTTDADGLAIEGLFSVFIDPTLLPASINVDITNQTWSILVFPGVLDLNIAGGSGGFGPPSPVPLPAGLGLLASALAALGWRRTTARS